MELGKRFFVLVSFILLLLVGLTSEADLTLEFPLDIRRVSLDHYCYKEAQGQKVKFFYSPKLAKTDKTLEEQEVQFYQKLLEKYRLDFANGDSCPECLTKGRRNLAEEIFRYLAFERVFDKAEFDFDSVCANFSTQFTEANHSVKLSLRLDVSAPYRDCKGQCIRRRQYRAQESYGVTILEQKTSLEKTLFPWGFAAQYEVLSMKMCEGQGEPDCNPGH